MAYMIKFGFLFTSSLLWACLSSFVNAIEPDEFLSADQAFHLQAIGSQSGQARFSWEIADGYYLYRNKFKSFL